MEIKKFAWIPTRVTSGKRIWLKSYYQHRYLYDTSTGSPPLNSLYFEWSETEKEKVIRLLKETVKHNRNIWNDLALTTQDKI
jgi:hypothetical protein